MEELLYGGDSYSLEYLNIIASLQKLKQIGLYSL